MATTPVVSEVPEKPKRAVSLEDDLERQVGAKIAEVISADDALKVFTEFRTGDRFSWWAVGEAALAIQVKQWWNEYDPEVLDCGKEPFTSFENFINRAMDSSRAKIFRDKTARAVLDALTPEDAVAIPYQNAKWLVRYARRVSATKWNKVDWIRKAKVMPEKDFGAFVNEKMPGAAREEVKERFSVVMDKSLKRVLMKAIAISEWKMKMSGDESYSDYKDDRVPLEDIMSDWLSSSCGIEGMSNVTNEELYVQRGKFKDKVKKIFAREQKREEKEETAEAA